MTEMKAMLRVEQKADKFIEIFESPSNFNKLDKLSIEELQKLNKMIVETIRTKREYTNLDKKRELQVGDVVEVDDKKFKGEVLEVLKLNTKKAKLKRENGDIWNIPYNYIK
jgi:uncharacterized Zn finger protein